MALKKARAAGVAGLVEAEHEDKDDAIPQVTLLPQGMPCYVRDGRVFT